MPKAWENFMRIDFTKEPKITDLVRFLKDIRPSINPVIQALPDPPSYDIPSICTFYSGEELIDNMGRALCLICDDSEKNTMKELKEKFSSKIFKDANITCYSNEDYSDNKQKNKIMKSASAFVILTPTSENVSKEYYEEVRHLEWDTLYNSKTQPYVFICEPEGELNNPDVKFLLKNEKFRSSKKRKDEVISETIAAISAYFDIRAIGIPVSQKNRLFIPGPDFYRTISFENIRLKSQQKLLSEFSRDLYRRTEDNTKENGFNVLDIGSFDGTQIIEQYGSGRNYDKLGKIIGIERDVGNYNESKRNEDTNGKIKFYNMDAESPSFKDDLRHICDENNIPGCEFDIINLSMILLHLMNPDTLLMILKPFLKKNGTIVIRDIDDCYTHAYPDPKGWFQNAKDICSRYCSRYFTAGARDGGKTIHTTCIKCGYSETDVVKIGINTSEVDQVGDLISFCPRHSFFDMYYGFIYEDMKILSQNSTKYIQEKSERESVVMEFEQMSSVYEEMKSEFSKPQFSFTLGFIFLTVKK